MSRLAFLMVLCSSAVAYAGSARATLDRTRVALEDEVTLTITTVGDSDAPQLPGSLGADFDVLSSGQAKQVSIINGRMSSSTSYTFTLSPKHAGTLTIPAVPVMVDDTRLATEPLQVVVAAPRTAGDQRDEELYVTAELTPTGGRVDTAYAGEQLVYTLRVVARVDASCPSLQLPDFPNAASYELGEQRQYRSRSGGEEVSVVEVRRAVFADKPGTLEIAPVRLTCTIERNGRRVDGFGSIFGPTGVRKVLRSNPLKLTILPLPPPPAGFSGLVGSVSVDAALSKNEARPGDSVTFTVKVRGDADMTTAPEPRIAFGAAVKTYDDKPTLHYDSAGASLIGERTFQKALVAQGGSDVRIAAPSLVYFDPRERKYDTAVATPLTLRLSGSATEAASKAEDITEPHAPEVTPAPRTQPQPGARFALRRSPAPLVAWLQPPRLLVLIALPLLAGALVRLARRPTNTVGRRARRDSAQRALRALESLRDSDVDAINQLVRELVGQRIEAGAIGLTSDEVVAALTRGGADSDLVARVRTVLSACDAALYGGAKDGALHREAVALARTLAEAA